MRIASWRRQRKRASRYRSIPGVAKQYNLLLRRAGLKWVRGWTVKFIDLLLFVGAATVVGEWSPIYAQPGPICQLQQAWGDGGNLLPTVGLAADVEPFTLSRTPARVNLAAE